MFCLGAEPPWRRDWLRHCGWSIALKTVHYFWSSAICFHEELPVQAHQETSRLFQFPGTSSVLNILTTILYGWDNIVSLCNSCTDDFSMCNPESWHWMMWRREVYYDMWWTTSENRTKRSWRDFAFDQILEFYILSDTLQDPNYSFIQFAKH